MAEVKKRNLSGKKSSSAKKKSTSRKGDNNSNGSAKNQLAAKQKRSLVMFISAVILFAVIFIPGEMVWLWLHNFVRGLFSVLAIYWPILLLFLSVVTMLEKPIEKLWSRVIYVSVIVVAFNAAIYIFGYGGTMNVSQTFADGGANLGGGVVGLALAAPFLKLFGAVPARILIVLIIIVLAIVLMNASSINVLGAVAGAVKSFFEMIVQSVTDTFVKAKVKKQRRKKAYSKVNDYNSNDYFDDDYDDYDNDYEDDYEDDENDDEDENRVAPKADDELPQSPVLSQSADAYDDYDEYEDDGYMDDEEVDIDEEISEFFETDDDSEDTEEYINVDMDFDPNARRNRASLSKTDLADPAPQKSESQNVNEDKPEDDGYFDVFNDDFLDIKETEQPKASKIAEQISQSKKTPRKSSPLQKQYDPQTVPYQHSEHTERKPQRMQSVDSDKNSKKDSIQRKPVKKKSYYPYPPIELLSEAKADKKTNNDAELKENARKLIDTLESFSVGAKICGYCRGPSITRYEIQPAPGVKISKITSLSDDIALNLAAEGVRIEAPIPGKPAIGIEIPNKSITPVSIRELIDSERFKRHKSKLACVLGRDVAGKIIITDLAEMPHLLIAGTTGSGKSVCVNGILMSLIFRASPEEVKMILVDPKLVEFSKYKGIPHLLVPVVSDVKKAAAALNWAVGEMETRYRTFSDYNVRGIDAYNAMVDKNLERLTEEEIEELEANPKKSEIVDGEFIPPPAIKKMPKIVIAIDELADLMMIAPGEVEDSICRLAQKARAAGMHLVIATQRPSVNVITGVIKANIPSRISLKVASYVDSKTILDAGGGEKLIGRGDMLYSPVGIPKPIRVQGGYASDEDIEAVTDYVKNHSKSDYDEDAANDIERIYEEQKVGKSKKNSDKAEGDDDFLEADPMLEDAITLVTEQGMASTSMLQRRFKLGYARAGRLIDTMEQMGIIGPHEGSKSRKVLITADQWLERRVTKSSDVTDEQ